MRDDEEKSLASLISNEIVTDRHIHTQEKRLQVLGKKKKTTQIRIRNKEHIVRCFEEN